MKKVPFLDLKAQYKSIKSEIDEAVALVLKDQFFILGKRLEKFERDFATYLKCRYVVGVGSGTDGLILALRAIGIKKQDEVITPVNSFIATTLAITELGAVPIFVDADKDTYQIDALQIDKKITKKTKAILPVHLYGAPCDMNTIMKVARKHKLLVIEDACQSHGATINDKITGTIGDLGVYSFYPGKNLGAYGDGGAICTNDEKLYHKLLKLRNYGQSTKYHHDNIGFNSRLDEIQAAILSVKLKYLDKWNKSRNQVAKKYISGIKNKAVFQKFAPGTVSNYHIFSILVKNRTKFMKFLGDKGIQTNIHYPIPIHLQRCYRSLGYREGDFPISERLAEQTVSLPMYAELDWPSQKYVIKIINSFS